MPPTLQFPAMLGTRRVGTDTIALRGYAPLPGFGLVPINAHVIRARQPVLVDTGIAVLQDSFLRELRSVIDPAELRWIWLTHLDADHIGNLRAVLAEAPNARIVTNYTGMGKMDLMGLPIDRAYLVNPGQTLDLGDRQLLAIRPPCYDAPETMGLFDKRSRLLVSSDCFGALMSQPAESVREMTRAALQEGMFMWSAFDAPWFSQVSEAHIAGALQQLRALAPAGVLSSHLPYADAGMAETLYETLLAARHAHPFIGPDQAALERMMGLQQQAA